MTAPQIIAAGVLVSGATGNAVLTVLRFRRGQGIDATTLSGALTPFAWAALLWWGGFW